MEPARRTARPQSHPEASTQSRAQRGPQRKPHGAAVVNPTTVGEARIDEVKEARPCETGRCATVPL